MAAKPESVAEFRMLFRAAGARPAPPPPAPVKEEAKTGRARGGGARTTARRSRRVASVTRPRRGASTIASSGHPSSPPRAARAPRRRAQARAPAELRPPELVRAEPLPPPSDKPDDDPLAAAVRALDMRDLVAEHPSLVAESDARRSQAAAGDVLGIRASDMKTAADEAALAEDPERVPPPEHDIIAKMGLLPRPVLAFDPSAVVAAPDKPEDASTSSNIERLLDARLYNLPVLGASYEAELLGEAGTHVHTNGKTYTFPACASGRACVGMTEDMREGTPTSEVVPMLAPREYKVPVLPDAATLGAAAAPVSAPGVRPRVRRVLMGFMWPYQWAQFLVDGIAPAATQHCVLCYRRNVGRLVMTVNGRRSAVVARPSMFVNPWTVVMGEEDGYIESCVFPGSGARFAALRGCFPLFRRGYLYWERRGSRWCINQTLMMAVRPVENRPRLGETLRLF